MLHVVGSDLPHAAAGQADRTLRLITARHSFLNVRALGEDEYARPPYIGHRKALMLAHLVYGNCSRSFYRGREKVLRDFSLQRKALMLALLE
jgi:hypothetical protein